MNKTKKVFITIAIITILTAIASYMGYKVLAKSTNEMLSEGDGLPAEYPYITYEDLISQKDTLCCGKGIPLPGSRKTVVESGEFSQSEPYLTMNDIGKKIFVNSKIASGDVTSNNFTNPLTKATSHTYAHYVESEKKQATPEEAYILAETSENSYKEDSIFYNLTNEEYTGKIDKAYFYNIYGTIIYGVDIDEDSGEAQRFVAKDPDSGKYYYIDITQSGEYFPYTYVQYAWWKTNAGGNSSLITATPFSREAEAFEEYINKVAKRDENGNIVKEEKTVTVHGITRTVQAPVIDYKISGEDQNAKVQYDGEKQKYLIGPFKVNYYEESVTTERGTVNFSAMTGTTIITNIGEVERSKWSFKYENREEDDKAEFPHNGEEFYIVLDYIEDMRYIEKVDFSFKYMNAAGEYSTLDGESFKAEWEPDSEAVWCGEGAKNCPCGGHHTNAQYDSNNKLICSGGAKKCSHGYYHNHIVRWNYWLELVNLEPEQAQPLAQVYIGVRWYEEATFSLNPDNGPEEYIRLTIPIAGRVWIDKEPDKVNPDYTEGRREDNEKGYKNAEVYVYKTVRDVDGTIISRELAKIFEEDNRTEINYPVYTDENGNYSIPNINVPGSEEFTKNIFDISFDVEFKYDGQHYEASAPLATSNGDAYKFIKASKEEKKEYENDSFATENEDVRNQYNNKFKEIYGGNAIDENGDTKGYASNGKDTVDLNYTSTEFSLPNNENARRLSSLSVLDENEHILEQYKMSATTGNAGIYLPVDNKISLDSADDVIELSVELTEYGKITTYKAIYDYMLHINLAVKEREEADLSTFKDLYKAEILVNEKELTKTYNKYVDVEDEENKEALEIQIEACKIGKYSLGLYSSDYEYRSTVYETSQDVVKNIKADTDMKVYLTYRIAINNESQAKEGLEATINQINDYYDKSFTLINSDVSANVLDNNQERISKVVAESPYYRVVKSDETAKYTYWSDGMDRFTCNDVNTQVNDNYKKLTITDLKDVKIAAGEQLEMFITFEVDKNGYKNTTERPNLLGEKNNIAEIANYSTYYPNGNIAGIIDRDSAPDNIDLNRNTKQWYEDDTESAPAVNIHLYKYNREINGNVWEDKETVDLLYGQKVANGIMDDGENGIEHIDVQLVEKIKIDDIEYEKIWTEDDFKDLTEEEKKEFKLKDVETASDGSYYLKGILAGNYVVRFKYGNKEANVRYNGQDYKNTAYQADMLNADGTTTLNNEWQDLKTNTLNEARISDARDYELQRMKVVAYSKTINNEIGNVLESADQDTNHSELIENTQMIANTAKLNIEIEHQDFIDYGVVNTVDGIPEYTYLVKNIDFGLEERSKTSIELDKKISKISLFKNEDSDEILKVYFNEDGTINKEKTDSSHINKVIHVDEKNNIQGLDYIPVESSYLNGARLKIEYTITVKNNSEVDWTGRIAQYETSEQILEQVINLEKTVPYVSGEFIEYGKYIGLNYYNNKNNEDDIIVTTKVENIIDYIDNDASSDKDYNTYIENSSWKEITLQDLQDEKLLDEKVYTIEKGKKLLLDSKGREYINENKNNVLVSENSTYNPDAICELLPEIAANELNKASSGKIRVVVSKKLSEENSKDDIYNNIAEILSYSNTVGRRDPLAVPGNAQVARGEYVAATGYKDGTLDTEYEGAKEVKQEENILHLNGEHDADAPNFVTITEPTGISIREYNQKQYMITIVVSGIIIAAGIIIIKKKLLK